MSQFPPMSPGSVGMRPHRGTLILILGILAFFICGIILGPVAFFMGSADLKAMRAGQMDPSGEGITNAGRICGLIAAILNVLFVVIWVVMMVVAVGAGVAGAGAAGSP